jgi:hypothetical protein
MTQKLTDNQQTWIKALRSGGFAQTTGCLHDNRGFCCLGIAAVTFKPDDVEVKLGSFSNSEDEQRFYDDSSTDAPEYVMDALQLRGLEGNTLDGDDSLALLNDGGMSFDRIADEVEANPANFFWTGKDPRFDFDDESTEFD